MGRITRGVITMRANHLRANYNNYTTNGLPTMLEKFVFFITGVKKSRVSFSKFANCLLDKKHRGIPITHYMKFNPLVVMYKNYKAGSLHILRFILLYTSAVTQERHLCSHVH